VTEEEAVERIQHQVAELRAEVNGLTTELTDMASGVAPWLSNHLDPQLVALHSRSAAFARCSPRHSQDDSYE
jgi:hypothetical protein